MRFCLNLKPTINNVHWRNFGNFLYFFVHFLKALPTVLLGKLFLFFGIYKVFQNHHVVFFDRISLRRLAKLYKNPRASLNLSVSPVQANKQNLTILGKDNNGVCV